MYCEKWYHNQDIVSEISGDITKDVLMFIPCKDASNGYEAMSATRILELNELLNKIYQGFGIRDEKRICLDESAQILAAGECRQRGRRFMMFMKKNVSESMTYRKKNRNYYMSFRFRRPR